jgi:hypothetical protein
MRVFMKIAQVDRKSRVFGVFGVLLTSALLASVAAPSLAQSVGATEAQLAPMPGPRLGSSLYSSEAQVRGNRVVRSIQANGTVAFGDQVDADAKVVKTTDYMSYSSPEALRRAQQERDYWQRQSEGLRQRQIARDRELEGIRMARQSEAALLLAQAQAEQTYGWRPVVGLRNFPPVQFSGVSQVFAGSPGLAGAAGGVLTSGFAGRR